MNNNIVIREQYSAPRLTCFGKVVELTAAGSGTGVEPNPNNGACQGNTKTNKPTGGCL